MQTANAPDAREDAAAQETLERYLRIDLPQLLSWLRAGTKWIVLCTLAGLLLGAGYAHPRQAALYRHHRHIDGSGRIADRFRRPFPPGPAEGLAASRGREQAPDAAVPQRAAARDRGPAIAAGPGTRAADLVDLAHQPAFAVRRIGGFASPEIIALDNLMRRVSARRDELSFVITMSVWSNSPDKSILISMRSSRHSRKSWSPRIRRRAPHRRRAGQPHRRAEGRVSAAEQAVEEFRRKNGLQATRASWSARAR